MNDATVLSSLQIRGNGGVASLSMYNGVRFKDSQALNELGIFLSTGTNYRDGLISYVINGTTPVPMIEYLSNASGSNNIGYFTMISSLTGSVEFGSGDIKAAAVSTNNLSTGQIRAGDVSANTLSTGFAYLGAMSTASAVVTGTANIQSVSTNYVYAGSADVAGTVNVAGSVSTNYAYVANLSTVSANVAGSLAADSVAANSMSTNYAYIRHLSTFNADVANLFHATTGTVDTLTSQNGTITTLKSDNLSTLNVSSGSAYVGTGMIDTLTVNNFTTTSDSRYKTNVEPLVGALAKVRALSPVFYDWINRPNLRVGAKELGFIAQEVEAVIPNVVAVSENEEHTRSVAYDRLTSLLAGAMKELADKVEALEARIVA
jgi:hypothetical protein